MDEFGFLEPFLALSWTFRALLHTREVAGSKPAAPIVRFPSARAKLACELQRDWARTRTAPEFKEILFGPAPVVDATGLGA